MYIHALDHFWLTRHVFSRTYAIPPPQKKLILKSEFVDRSYSTFKFNVFK